MRIPIVIKLWAGDNSHDFEYIRQSIPSLLRSDLPKGAEICLFDDCSPNPALRPFLDDLSHTDKRIRLFMFDKNKGPNKGQEDAYRIIRSEYPDSPLYLNLDDDVVYSKTWFNEILLCRQKMLSTGIDGIFSAMNMPLRPHFRRMANGNRVYLLKRRQPALNWVIPNGILKAVGSFKDEGIAYDSVYSYRMRLFGYPIICIKPSFAQNIGLQGAYATDAATTAGDFIGEGEGASRREYLFNSMYFKAWRLYKFLKTQFRYGTQIHGPIRWGSEWVYEGKSLEGTSVAVCPIKDAVDKGWTLGALEARIAGVEKILKNLAPFNLTRVHRSMDGKAIFMEYRHEFMPTLRDFSTSLRGKLDNRTLFESILRDLVPFHMEGKSHNKIRRDNVYIDPTTQNVRVAWFGTELPPGADFSGTTRPMMAKLCSAVDSRTDAATKAVYAERYLETVAPEIACGGPATPSSDVYSAAAAVVLTNMKEEPDIGNILNQHKAYARNLNSAIRADARLRKVLAGCLCETPQDRYPTAMAALETLH